MQVDGGGGSSEERMESYEHIVLQINADTRVGRFVAYAYLSRIIPETNRLGFHDAGSTIVSALISSPHVHYEWCIFLIRKHFK